MLFQLLAAALAAAQAQGAPDAAAPAPVGGPASVAPSEGCCLVPALTPVEIEITEALGSKISKPTQTFAFRLVEPLVIDGKVVAPVGTTGGGEVVHAAKARAMGKAGELILAARYLDVAGQRVPLRSLRYGPSQGKDNAGTLGVVNTAAAAVLPVAAVAAFFISGGDIHIPAGTRANAKVAADTRLTPGQ